MVTDAKTKAKTFGISEELAQFVEFKKGAGEPELGKSPDAPLQEMHPDAGRLRLIIKNLATSPETAQRLLEQNGFQTQHLGGLDFALKKPEEDAWRVLDPEGFDVRDITDLGGEAATVVGGVLGFAGGGVAGGALGGAAVSGLRGLAGQAFGLEPTGGEIARQVGTEAVLGGALPALGAAAGAGARAAGRGVRGLLPASARQIAGLSDEALQAQFRQATGKVPVIRGGAEGLVPGKPIQRSSLITERIRRPTPGPAPTPIIRGGAEGTVPSAPLGQAGIEAARSAERDTMEQLLLASSDEVQSFIEGRGLRPVVQAAQRTGELSPDPKRPELARFLTDQLRQQGFFEGVAEGVSPEIATAAARPVGQALPTQGVSFLPTEEPIGDVARVARQFRIPSAARKRKVTGELTTGAREQLGAEVLGRSPFTRTARALGRELEDIGDVARTVRGGLLLSPALRKLAVGGRAIGKLGQLISKSADPLRRIREAKALPVPVQRQIDRAINLFDNGDMSAYRSAVFVLLSRPVVRKALETEEEKT